MRPIWTGQISVRTEQRRRVNEDHVGIASLDLRQNLPVSRRLLSVFGECDLTRPPIVRRHADDTLQAVARIRQNGIVHQDVDGLAGLVHRMRRLAHAVDDPVRGGDQLAVLTVDRQFDHPGGRDEDHRADCGAVVSIESATLFVAAQMTGVL